MTRNRIAVLALLSLALPIMGSLPGCIASAKSRSNYRGRYISPQVLDDIKPGKSQQYVLAVCGQPTRRQSLGLDSSVWVYEYEKDTYSSGRLVVLEANRRSEERGKVVVEFKENKVTRAFRIVE